MGLLLYKSDEMYSSTELIRKSKMIFDKVLDKEIDKAIILRDGKPCFLLMEFQKYEKIMAEYEELKNYVNSLKEHTEIKVKSTKSLKKSKKEKLQKEKTEQTPYENKDIFIEEEMPVETKPQNSPIQNITSEDKSKIEQRTAIHKEQNQISEEQELKEAMQSIESMNFDDAMKKEAQEKIHIRILKARKERAKILADEQQHKEDLKEELILQGQLKEKKIKKDRELQEFWD